MKRRTAIYARTNGTEPELLSGLRRIVEFRGDVVVDTFVDDTTIERKGKNADWNRLLANLDQIDQIVLHNPGDIPGRTIGDLLKFLQKLTAHSVSIVIPSLNIDTSAGAAAVIALTAAYRKAKKSAAIRYGQRRARAAGKYIGRPPIPTTVRQRVVADLSAGAGIRSTARRFKVSAGSVSAIRKSIAAGRSLLAA
jgi:DNA invertase Pin-like site-specific DNA recombinase